MRRSQGKSVIPLPLPEKADYHFRMDEKDIAPRIGTFFWILGIALIALFIASNAAGEIDFRYLLGLPSIILAILFRRKANPKPKSDRFSIFRKIKERKKKD